MNIYGMTLDYDRECSAWVINTMGPARRRCNKAPIHNIAGVAYFCRSHYRMVLADFEDQIETTRDEQVRNLEAQLKIERQPIEWVRHLPPERPAPKPQIVYFIRCQQFIKIGISRDPAVRLNQIRKGGGSTFPRLLDVATAELLTTEPGGREQEKALHAKFAHLRHTGEWFTEAPELTNYITSLQEIPA